MKKMMRAFTGSLFLLVSLNALAVEKQMVETLEVETLTVMTSYPETVVSRYEEAFEQAHPGVKLQILWRMPHDALPYLLQEKQGGVDVVWLASAQTFRALKKADALQTLRIDRSGLPAQMGDTALADDDGKFLATEMAGYGVFLNTDKMRTLGLKTPTRWQDLAQPAWRDQVVLPVPSNIGFAPMLIDQLLQAEGWEAGWNQWRAIAANSRLFQTRGQFISDEVAEGRAVAALMLDFFAASALANGATGEFVYPQQTAFNPAHIAITRASQHTSAAEAFVAFVESDAGQSLLFHPDIRKLPVRPSVYANAPPAMTNPFTLKLNTRYDQSRGLPRRAYISALFDAAITRPHALLVQATTLLQKNTAPPAQQAQAQQLLSAWPVAEPALEDAVAAACERRQQTAAAEAQCAQAEAEWNRFFDEHYRKAIALLIAKAG